MEPFVASYFQWARSQVSEDEILDFTPSTQGYWPTVQRILEIFRLAEVKPGNNVYLIEAIMAAIDPSLPTGPSQRAYRRFLTASGLMLLFQQGFTDFSPVLADFALELLQDSASSGPLELLQGILATTRQRLLPQRMDPMFQDGDFVFFGFAQLIVAQRHSDFEAAARFAARLIEDESLARIGRSESGHDFLFGLGCCHDNARKVAWKAVAAELTNPKENGEIALVIDALQKVEVRGG